MDPLELDWIYYDEHYDSNGKERIKTPKSAKCPLCHDDVNLGSQAKIGDRVICCGCDAQLEIVSLVPPELDWPYDGGFDYYFEDDDTLEEKFDDYEN